MNGIGVVRAGDAWKQTIRTVPKKLVPAGRGERIRSASSPARFQQARQKMQRSSGSLALHASHSFGLVGASRCLVDRSQVSR